MPTDIPTDRIDLNRPLRVADTSAPDVDFRVIPMTSDNTVRAGATIPMRAVVLHGGLDRFGRAEITIEAGPHSKTVVVEDGSGEQAITDFDLYVPSGASEIDAVCDVFIRSPQEVSRSHDIVDDETVVMTISATANGAEVDYVGQFDGVADVEIDSLTADGTAAPTLIESADDSSAIVVTSELTGDIELRLLLTGADDAEQIRVDDSVRIGGDPTTLEDATLNLSETDN